MHTWRGRGFEGISTLGKSDKTGNKLKEEHSVQVVKMKSKQGVEEGNQGCRQAGSAPTFPQAVSLPLK